MTFARNKLSFEILPGKKFVTLFLKDEQYKNFKTKIRCFNGRECIPSASVIFDLGLLKFIKNI